MVHPGHDYVGRAVTTLGEERATNPALLEDGRERFQARFGGVARDICVPLANVAAIYARENGAGMAFDIEAEAAARAGDDADPAAAATPEPDPEPTPPARPRLLRIK